MRRPSLNSSTFVIVIFVIARTVARILKKTELEDLHREHQVQAIRSWTFRLFSYTVIEPTQLRLCMPMELLPIRSGMGIRNLKKLSPLGKRRRF
jgi:hypothetical protein